MVALAPLCAGCGTAIHLMQSPPGGEAAGGGTVRVRVFETRTDRGRDAVTRKEVLTELYRLDGAGETLVREGREARWSATDLPAGRYVLRAVRCVDEWGVVRTQFEPADVRFSVRGGQTTSADVVLEDPGPAWHKVLGAIVVVVIADLEVERRLDGVQW